MRHSVRRTRLLTMITCLATMGVIASSGWGQSGTWTTRQSMPTPRGALAAGVLNGKIIATGGSTPEGTTFLTTVEEYDPATDTWEIKSPLPKGMEVHGIAVANGVLYSIGGCCDSPGYTRFANVYAYDPLTDTWAPRSSMPTARAYLGVGVINGLVYAVGGDNEGRLATLEVYDPVTDLWTTKAPMSAPRYGMGVGVVNGVLYAVGGATIEAGLGTVEAYDPTTDSWSTKSPMPTPRLGLTVEVVDGILYAIGGGPGGGTAVFTTVEAYDPATDKWSAAASMPTPRSFPASATVNGTLFVIGGEGALANGLFPTTGVTEAFGPPAHFTAFLHGTGATANPATLFLDQTAPSGSTAKYRDSTGVSFSGGNIWKDIGFWAATPAISAGTLSQLGPFQSWIGLKNSDDQGTRFDVRVEVFKNSSLISAGETHCIQGVTRNPSNALPVAVSFGSFPPVSFNATSDQLSLRILTRIGTNSAGGFCGGHNNATGLRLYFDSAAQASALSATR